MMSTTRNYLAVLIFVASGISAVSVDGAELLGNANLEALAPSLLGWGLEETVTDSPGTSINSAQIEGFANQPMELPGESGLWLRAFEGNVGDFEGQNKMSNAFLSQTVPGVAGETYTLKGWSKWESNYSGAVETLDITSPSGEVPSPTETNIELAFLDANEDVIGAPVTLDLRTEQFGDNIWREHTLPASVAPAGTASVRVTASATDMVYNTDPGQSGFYDTFSLAAASAPGTDLLTNGKLNFVTGDPVFTLSGNIQFNTQGFANHTPGGTVGAWLRSFLGGDGTVTQTVPGTAGEDYTFSAWSKWETNYSGGQTGTATQTMLEMAFLDGADAVIGTPVTLDLRTEQMNGMDWKQHTLMGTAPGGTAKVRVSGLATGMVNTTGQQGAFFDDFSLMLAAAGIAGDYNDDGTVNAADYVVWRDNEGTTNTLPNDPTGGTIGPTQYNTWRANFGMSAGSGVNLLAAAVPEPAGCWLAVSTLIGAVGLRRRRATTT